MNMPCTTTRKEIAIECKFAYYMKSYNKQEKHKSIEVLTLYLLQPLKEVKQNHR